MATLEKLKPISAFCGPYNSTKRFLMFSHAELGA